MDEKREEYPITKDIIKLLGIGMVLAAALVMPGIGTAAGHFIKEHKQKEWEKQRRQWSKYNYGRLRQVIRRLHHQKMVEVIEKDGEAIIGLTQKGRRRYLRARLEDLMVEKQKKWDGKWRLIIYDIPASKRLVQDMLRRFLRRFEFLPLQKSVYLYPYPCENEIEWLRQYFEIGDKVIMLTVSGLENEDEYRKYFGL